MIDPICTQLTHFLYLSIWNTIEQKHTNSIIFIFVLILLIPLTIAEQIDNVKQNQELCIDIMKTLGKTMANEEIGSD